MKQKTTITIILSLLFCISINSQVFQDNPGNEKDGAFPSKWELLKGSAQIESFEGSKVISLTHDAIITPLLNSKNYLSDNFTLKFSAYFDKLKGAVYYYQYYTIRFWDGTGSSKRAPGDDSYIYDPLQIQRNGARFIGYKPNRENSPHQVFNKNLENKEAAWRSIIISYNNGAFKLSIDGIQILNIPRLNYKPVMISIGCNYNLSDSGVTRGIKNIQLSGISGTTNTTGNPDTNDAPPANDTTKINTTIDNNANPNTALVYGDFEQKIFRVNGRLQIGNPARRGYVFPLADGRKNQVLQTDGNGNLSWTDLLRQPAGNTPPTPQADTSTKYDTMYSGLRAINDGNGIGWRLIRGSKNVGKIGENAIDMSFGVAGNLNEGARGIASFAAGQAASAEGDYSVSMGYYSRARSIYSLAFGRITLAEGEGSIALGMESEAKKDHSTAIGYKVKANGLMSLALGNQTTASGSFSTALGTNTIASGGYSTAIGKNTTASGGTSTAMGENTTASGSFTTAMGYYTVASGGYSTAMGNGSIASGPYSIAMGTNTKSESYSNTAIGANNIGGGNSEKWIASDPLFEIGNGTINKRSNALTVLKNGNTGIGTHTPQVKLQIENGTDASLQTGGYVIIGDKQGENIVFDNNEIMARKNVQPSTLYLQHEGGDVFVGGAVVHSSDFRLKKDIEELSYGLKEILQLRPVSYYWKSGNDTKRSIGLIAQEVEPVIKEVVSTGSNADDMLGVNYTELIPVLVKAMQDQQILIEKQQVLIETLQKRLEKLEKNK
ncbi:MAG TPA: tail fiber domain-containing protein [Chitinophagaceae bacterium]|nr:tail fiber domain-containing protein [Chitinophagaceae bacterium]MCB9054899.1 tail fiber domain-containing protein [Chitinophagales bacterium]HPG11087.1 tail fiber domain-containing protein [Chitinophagaceae bacterium]HRX92624.1 tail fiber domain-containing protein [Chitinophagaceae bacterium]